MIISSFQLALISHDDYRWRKFSFVYIRAKFIDTLATNVIWTMCEGMGKCWRADDLHAKWLLAETEKKAYKGDWYVTDNTGFAVDA